MSVSRARRLAALALVGSVAFLVVLLSSGRADAYPWMIRHGYSGCLPCHTDPTGAGLLTAYGRAQGELLLRTRYGGKKGEEEEAGPAAGFLWGLATPPDWLLVSASFRGALLATESSGTFQSPDLLLMQADARAQVTLKRFRAYGSIGVLQDSTYPQANITSNQSGVNLISREHWIGVDIGEDKNFLLRAGRLDLPFGIRQIEHNLLLRMSTQTDINTSQEHGIAFSYSGENVRGEIMGIAGNFQLNPDKFRQRGYSGFVEVRLGEHASIGASSLTTHVDADPTVLTLTEGDVRMAHGLFTRLAPAEWFVVMAEADALLLLPSGTPTAPLDSKAGVTSMLQVDIEPIQGVHFMATGEAQKQPQDTSASYGGWASAVWFFAPHADIRFDFVDQKLSGAANGIALLPQLHLYL